MHSDLKNAQNRLEQIQKGTTDFLNQIATASEKADSKSSSVLFGIAGGILGATVGIIAAPAIGISILTFSTLSTSFGIIGGILFYRGKDGIAFEKMMSKNAQASEEILRRINSLPEDAPQIVRDELWNNYRALNGSYTSQISITLSPSTKKVEEHLPAINHAEGT